MVNAWNYYKFVNSPENTLLAWNVLNSLLLKLNLNSNSF